MNCYCLFSYEAHRLEGYQPTPAALLSTCEKSWNVENPVVLNKCLLNSQRTETKTQVSRCVSVTLDYSNLYSDNSGDGRLQ